MLSQWWSQNAMCEHKAELWQQNFTASFTLAPCYVYFLQHVSIHNSAFNL